jgi:hypothetical protein
MELKNSKIFNKEIMQSVSAFCESQEIKDVDNFIYLCFKQGFDIKRYGLLEKTLNDGEKDLIKEVIVEKLVEIPVEVIKEVEKIVEVIKEVSVEVIKEIEKIVEVPIDRIVEKIVEVTKEIPVEKVVIQEVIKEVPVDRVIEKKIYITDDSQVKELGEKITTLEGEMSKKDKELNELRQTLDKLLVKPPVEIIKEVEKIVTNVEYIRDENTENQLNEKLKLLQETLQNLRGDLQQKNEKIKELEKINRELLNGPNQGYLLRGSNLNRKV